MKIEHTWTDADRLTREEMMAGAPCRGCGLPLTGEPWEPITPLQKINGQVVPVEDTDLADRYTAQLAIEAADRAEYLARHAGCRSGTWRMEGSRWHHCTRCCPPHPLSARQLHVLSELFYPTRPDAGTNHRT